MKSPRGSNTEDARLRKELREMTADRDEYRQMSIRAREEERSGAKANDHMQHIRMAMYDSLIQEQYDLDARLLRIDQRLKVLQLHPDQIREANGSK